MGVVLVVVLAACGSGDDGSQDAGLAESGDGGPSGAADGQSVSEPNSDGSERPAAATLVVGDETYAWEGNQWTYCETDGIFPANAKFQDEATTQSGNWVQFIDRGDGGINFSAVLEGEEYTGTGSGEADEITDSGFTYTGDLNNRGESYDIRLEVSCR